MTTGPVVSKIICLIKIDTNDNQTNVNGTPFFSYSRGHETSKKLKSGHSSDRPYYNTTLPYTESKNMNVETGDVFFGTLKVMTHRENMKVTSRPMDPFTIFP